MHYPDTAMSKLPPEMPHGFARSEEDDFRILRESEDAISSPLLLQGLAHWQSIRGSKPMPSRADFDPVTAPPGLLPHIMLIDVHHQDPIRFRYRLIGTHVTGIMMRDSTGKWLDELYNQHEYDVVTYGILAAVRTRRPVPSLAQAPSDSRSFLQIESIDMPLSSNGKDVDMVMALCHMRAPD